MKKVFYVSYGGGHANISRFIYKELEKDPGVEQEVLALIMADKVFDYSGVPYKYLSQYLPLFTEEEREEILALGEEIAKTAHNPDTTMKYEETVAYMGFGMWDLINRYGKEKAQEMFDAEQRKSFLPITVMRRIFDYVKPDCVVITCEVRMEKAAAAVANERGIPVVRVSDTHWVLPLGYDCVTCVLNDAAREYAINEVGLNPKQVVVTGHPVFENDSVVEKKDIEIIKEAVNSEGFKNIVLFVPSHPEDSDTIDCFYESAKNNKEILFIIKPHPNDIKGVYRSFRDNVKVIYDHSLPPLFSISDVVVTTTSTSGLEAVFANKPLITINTKRLKEYPLYDFANYGIAIKINNSEDLDSAILDCLNPKSDAYRKLQEGRKEFQNKKNATKNISAVIINEMNKI